MVDYIVVGLGNPGKKFEQTRHNAGAVALRSWVLHRGGMFDFDTRAAVHSEIATVEHDTLRVACLIPRTYMNTSGDAVAAFCKQHPSLDMSHVVIIHDELEVPFGDVKIKRGGSAGGHNGVRSVHERLGTQDMRRIRIGIGRPRNGDVEQFVLSRWTPREREQLPRIMKKAADTLDKMLLGEDQSFS